MTPAIAPAGSPARQARRVRYLGLALCLAAAAAHAPAARAQAPDAGTDGWSTLQLPGGTAALLSAAGLDPARPRTTALLDVIRVVHEVRPGLIPALDERRARLVSYLETLNQLLAARAALPPGTVQSSATSSGNTRKSLKLLGLAIGASLQQRDRAYTLELTAGRPEEQRRAWLKAAGLDVERVVSEFNAGRPMRLDLKSDDVPLPLSASAWRSLPGMSGWLARAILLDQHASWLYLGLCGMDEETRRYLGATPQLLQRIHDSDRAAVMPLHAGSLHVREGRVHPPGGDQATPLWESLAGAPVTDPGRFMLAVLGKNRLAHLYDAVDRMDAPGQAFALGSWITDPGHRLERFKALYDVIGDGLGVWDPASRPFTRAVYDPGHVLIASSVLPDGRPGALGWLTFWEKAFDGETLPAQPSEDLKDVERGGPLDAASLVRLVGALSNRTRRELCEAWCFGQRLFAKVPRESLPDVLVTLRGYSRYSVVSLTLERLGVIDPSVHASAVIRAEQIARIGDADRSALALALHQGAFALIERARMARTLDARAAARLVASLNQLPLSTDGEFLGAVAAWIEAQYLPAIGATPARDVDAQLIAAFAGRRQGDAVPDRSVEYDGTRYRVDPSRAERARIGAIREKQGGASLDATLAFAREANSLSVGLATVAEVPGRVARLRAAAEAVLKAQPRASTGWSRPAELASTLHDALGDLSGIRKAQDLKKLDRIAVALQRAADWELGRVLVSFAYAASLGDPDSTALVAGDPSSLHEWGIASPDENRRARLEWTVARETHDVGGQWHVEGSLLALDLGLGTDALRRLSSDALSWAPTISDNHRRAFTEAAVLANAADYTDEDMALLAQAIERGRARIAALAADPGPLADIADTARLDAGRRSLLSWAIVHEKDCVPRLFSYGDLLRLGRLDLASVRDLDAWGTSGLSYDGRLCLRFPVSQPVTGLAGRWANGIMPTLVPDLALLVAEALHQRRLPAVLARSMLLVATPDYMDRLALAHEDDWLTLVSDVQRILPPRIDDYLASVTTGGPLVPLRQPGGGQRE